MVVDAGYPANTDLVLESGTPVLKRRKGADRRPSALALEQAVHQRLPECSLLDLPGAKVRHMSSPGHSCQTLTSHEDQNNTLKPDRQRHDGVQPKSPRPVRARFPS